MLYGTKPSRSILRQAMLPYSGLFMQGATFADIFNVPQAGYFHCCTICDIKPHEWHQAQD